MRINIWSLDGILIYTIYNNMQNYKMISNGTLLSWKDNSIFYWKLYIPQKWGIKILNYVI